MEGYETIMWLVASVMLKRDFAIKAEVRGLDAVLEDCPYDDLTKEQRVAFEARLADPLAKSIIQVWWNAYDKARASGEQPDATANGDFWMP